MAILRSTDANVRAAYADAKLLTFQLQQYVQGDAPVLPFATGSAQTIGRFSATDIDANITALKAKIDAINSAT
jgi:hypothetical protein